MLRNGHHNLRVLPGIVRLCGRTHRLQIFCPNKRMKILAVLTYYHPHWTGLSAHARRIAEGLVARGHTVTVLTARHSPELASEEIVNGVHVLRLPVLGRLSRGMLMPTFPSVAAAQIARHDVVQIHTPMFEAFLVAGLCRLLAKPFLMSHHGDLVMPDGLFNRFTEWAVTRLMTRAGRLADRVSTYSPDYAAHSPFLQQFADKLIAIFPPVTIPTPQPDKVAAWRQELGLTDQRLVGFAGRFVEEKGFDFLIEALPLIKQQIPNAHFVFAGETNVAYETFYQRLQPQIAHHRNDITLLGLLLDPQQLANFYAMCDVFTLPSRTDCFALVQVEALLSGTPLVTSDIPGARVVVQETGMGRLVAPRDPQALADGIVEVLQQLIRYRPDPPRVRALFDPERTLDQYENCMQELARPHRCAAPSPTLGPADQQTLARLLRNEADMAFRRRTIRLLEWLDLHDGERVFDCGCGMGFHLMAIGKLRQLRLVGLDGDMDRLHWAQREAVPATLFNGDILRLPFAESSFDKILMSEVLEHLGDDRQALTEIFRVLKPGGILALSVPHARYPFWWDPINSIWIALGGQPLRSGPIAGIWSNHERLYEPADVQERIRTAGFNVEIVEEATHYSFPLSHFLVYGIGKPLIEHNLLPTSLRNSSDRFRGEQNSGNLLNPITLGLAIVRGIDRLNDRSSVAQKASFVNVLVKARRPHAR